MGAVTVSVEKKLRIGHLDKMILGEVTMSSSYATGGDTVNWGGLGLKRIYRVVLEETDGGLLFRYDHVNSKILAYHFDYAATAAGPAVEVPAATDLSARKLKFMVIGR